jgi:hypothetical protein
MFNAFYNPAEAVIDAKKFGDWTTTLGVLALTAVLIAVAPIIAMKSFIWYISLGAIAAIVVGVFIGGLLLKVVLSILGAKNPGYLETVSAIVYSAAPLASAMFVSSLLLLIPVVGIVLAGFLMVIGGLAMSATHIRAIKELCHTDLLMAVIAGWVVMSMGITLGYAMGFLYSFATLGMGALFTAASVAP